MVDVQELKAHIDLRVLVEADLGKPVSRGSTAWTWKCPFHQEHKGAALAVWKDGWRCFGACGEGGDAIAWVMKRHDLDFPDAVRLLGGGIDPPRAHVPARANALTAREANANPPPSDWQASARQIVEQAQETLWTAEGQPALTYLTGRGLLRETIREARLGYVPGHYRQWRNRHGLNVPCGITIPWIAGGSLWGIKVRRAAGDIRYEQIAGGKIAGSLYWADRLLAGWTALLVEGEFNCLIAWQEAMDIVCPVSLGSASTALNTRWNAALVACPRILACFDADEAGTKAADRLQSLSARVKLIRVPEGKDLNEYHLLRSNGVEQDAVHHWLQKIL